MATKLYELFVKNWRTTLLGLLGAVAVAVSNYVQAGHPTWIGLGLAAALALVGAVSKDLDVANLGLLDKLIAKHGLSAVTDYLQKVAKEQSVKTVVTLVVALLLLLPCLAQAQSEPLPANLYAAGVSYNVGGSPAVAGTGLYARLLSGGTYAFSVVDALPLSVKPFTVSTNFGFGVAQKVVTIANVPIFVPTSAGISYNGNNTGWAWSTGGLAAFKVKGNLRVLPNVRIVKSSVSNGAGYQPIVGVLFGWGQ